MAKPTLYKKRPVQDVRNRTTSLLSSSELNTVNNTISKFFELFKDKHLR